MLASFGPQPNPLEWAFKSPGIEWGSVVLDSQYLVIPAVTVIVAVFQYFFFKHALLGKCGRLACASGVCSATTVYSGLCVVRKQAGIDNLEAFFAGCIVPGKVN